MDATPGVQELLLAQHRNRFGWRQGLAEMIDNALDAGATQVEITLGTGKKLEIRDDGAGIRDMEAVARIGHHLATGEGIGRYGVGLKDFALYLWGSMQVWSCHRSKGTSYRIVWQEQKEWQGFPDPKVAEHAGDYLLDPSHGTTFWFTKFDPRLPNLEKLLRDLEAIYFPAIRAGKQIRIREGNRRFLTVAISERPLLYGEIQECFPFGRRRTAHLKIGIAQESEPNPNPGISQIFQLRVINPRSAIGCGDYGTARIYGELTFEGEWALERNKGGIAEDLQELEARIFQKIEPLLKEAQQQTQSLAANRVAKKVNARLASEWAIGQGERRRPDGKRPRRPRRPRGEETGEAPKARKPVGAKGRIRRPLAKGLVVEFAEIGEELIGEVSDNRVRLNRRHAYVEEIVQTENWTAAHALVYSLACHEQIHYPTLRLFRKMGDSLGKALWDVIPQVEDSESDCPRTGRAPKSGLQGCE